MRQYWSLFGSSATAVVLALSAPHAAAAQEQQYRFNIPAQQLGNALRAFGQQARQQIVYADRDVSGKQSAELVGSYTARDGLQKILMGSGLTASRTQAGVLYVGNGNGGAAKSAAATATPSADVAPATSSNNSSVMLNELVVTAQKREERLVDVPISISVLTGRQLDRSPVQGTTEALVRVPGVAANVTYQGGGTQLVVRGVTAGGALANGSSPVSYYLDSVPFGLVRQAVAPDPNAYDLERVEVLRGPQGTLYGASSQNGVVRVLTRDAQLDAFEAKARASGATTKGGDESYRADAALNVPIVDGVLAARIVAGYQHVGGWIDRPNAVAGDDSNDADIRNVRVKVAARPTDRLSLDLSTWFSRANFGGPSIAQRDGTRLSRLDEPIKTYFDLYAVKVDYDFSAFTLSSSTSSLNYFNHSFIEHRTLQPNVSNETLLDAKVFTQEVILNSTTKGDWRWTAGGIYRDAHDRQYQQALLNGVTPTFTAPADFTYGSESFAIFGSVTRALFDDELELTVGLRYFEDAVTLKEVSRVNNPTAQLINSKDKFTALSPRIAATWRPRPNTTLYASYSQGFRSGFGQAGSVLSIVPDFPPVKPDTLSNYEVGAKGTLFDGRMDVDAAFYYIDWQDVQQSLLVGPVAGTTTIFPSALVNAPSASGVGIDLGVTARPLRGLEFGVTASWNNLEFDKPVVSRGLVLFDAGDRLNISPEYTVGAFAEYAVDLPNQFTGRFAGSINWTSELDLRTIAGTQRIIADGDAIALARASFTLESPDHWSAALFVENLANEQGEAIGFPFAAAITDANTQQRPRTIGIQLEYRY